MTGTIRESVQAAADRAGFSGVVSIRRSGKILHRKAFGFRNAKERLPNTVTTKFGIASGTKLFTALGIGRLIDAGQLSLHTTMKELDGRFRGFIDENATILDLLRHTSGVYDYYDEEQIADFEHFTVEIPWSHLATPSDYFPLFAGKPMKFEAGRRCSYSNGGYVLLGMIIEQISGQIYRNFVAENVMRLAEMRESDFYSFDDLPENTAAGYLDDRRTTNIYRLPIRGGGDGGMYTTAEDLDRFWPAFLSGKILSPELTAEFLKTQWVFNETDGYGCGIYRKLDADVFSITGGDAGVGFFSRHYLHDATTLSVFSNVTGGEAEAVHAALRALEEDENANRDIP